MRTINGGLVTEVKEGLHKDYTLIITANNIFESLAGETKFINTRDELAETLILTGKISIEISKIMIDAVNSGMYDRDVKILYVDNNTMHVNVQSTYLKDALVEGSYICELITEACKKYYNTTLLPNANIYLVADEIYYKKKKQYIIKMVWFKGVEIAYPTFRFVGYKIKNIEDLLILDL